MSDIEYLKSITYEQLVQTKIAFERAIKATSNSTVKAQNQSDLDLINAEIERRKQ